MNNKILAFSLLFGLVAATGCAVHEGHEKHVNQPTIGAELIDLQMAFDKGAISEQEHQKLKDQLEYKRNKQ